MMLFTFSFDKTELGLSLSSHVFVGKGSQRPKKNIISMIKKPKIQHDFASISPTNSRADAGSAMSCIGSKYRGIGCHS